MPSDIHRIDPDRPDPALIKRAVRTMQTGGIVVFPTSGLYGLGADATNPDAVARIFQIKHRATANPILVLIPDAGQLSRWVTTVPETARRLMYRYWPGRLTLVFRAAPHLPGNLTAGTGKIGVRVSAHPVARSLVNSVDFPVTATSANLAGQPGCATINDMTPKLVADTDMVLDAGRLRGGSGSTVVDVTVDPPKILRSGTVTVETKYFQFPAPLAVDKPR